jgi:Na+-transporting methylmalonyl-CoA/oxaloacetate decarboxylase gamma subunit
MLLQADRFVNSGRALRRKMWWNNLKMKLVMGVAVIMVILIIFLLICFGSGKSCVKKGDKSNPAPAEAASSPAPAEDSSAGRRLLMTAAGEAAQALMASW